MKNDELIRAAPLNGNDALAVLQFLSAIPTRSLTEFIKEIKHLQSIGALEVERRMPAMNTAALDIRLMATAALQRASPGPALQDAIESEQAISFESTTNERVRGLLRTYLASEQRQVLTARTHLAVGVAGRPSLASIRRSLREALTEFPEYYFATATLVSMDVASLRSALPKTDVERKAALEQLGKAQVTLAQSIATFLRFLECQEAKDPKDNENKPLPAPIDPKRSLEPYLKNPPTHQTAVLALSSYYTTWLDYECLRTLVQKKLNPGSIAPQQAPEIAANVSLLEQACSTCKLPQVVVIYLKVSALEYDRAQPQPSGQPGDDNGLQNAFEGKLTTLLQQIHAATKAGLLDSWTEASLIKYLGEQSPCLREQYNKEEFATILRKSRES